MFREHEEETVHHQRFRWLDTQCRLNDGGKSLAQKCAIYNSFRPRINTRHNLASTENYYYGKQRFVRYWKVVWFLGGSPRDSRVLEIPKSHSQHIPAPHCGRFGKQNPAQNTIFGSEDLLSFSFWTLCSTLIEFEQEMLVDATINSLGRDVKILIGGEFNSSTTSLTRTDIPY